MVYIKQGEVREFAQTVAEGLDDIHNTALRLDNAQKGWARENLPSKYHPSKYDRMQVREESYLKFAKWRMACEESQVSEYVESEPSLIYIIPTEGRKPAVKGNYSITMADSVGIVNMRDVGIGASVARNLMQHGTDYMKSKEGVLGAVRNANKLNKAGDIKYIAVGTVPEDALYGVAYLDKDSVLLFINRYAYKKMEAWAEKEGVEISDLIKRAMGEEICLHIANKGEGPSVKEEKDVRKELINVYNILAASTSNPKIREKYQRMVECLRTDLETVEERYSKIYSGNLRGLVGLYNTDIGELEKILAAEALKEGKNTREGITRYVSEKLKEIKEAAKDGYKGKDNEDKEAEDNPDEDGAEIVEEDDESCAEAESGDGGGEGGSE